MTPTPAELALWRALNREPDVGKPVDGHVQWGSPYHIWFSDKLDFGQMHPADRLAYFEGKVREAGAGGLVLYDPSSNAWTALWHSRDSLDSIARHTAPTEHEARFHASARALAALGVITDDVMKEISDETA